MNDLQDWLKTIFGIILVIASIVFGIWLCLFVMLYGGIMQAVECWGVDNSAVVWGIIRAIFTSAGTIPSYIGIFIALEILKA